MEQFFKHFGYKDIDEIFDELKDKNLVGSSGSSVAYKILNKKENKFYLLKKINKSRLSENNSVNEVENESEILKNINHQNIVKYYYSFAFEENYFIIMEYCENSDLLKFIEKHKKPQKLINEKVILIIILLDICCGLKEIHK